MKSFSKHLWLTAAALAVVVFGASSPAAAQDAANVEVSGGYQYNRIMLDKDKTNCGSNCDENLNGWYADVAGSIRSAWSWVGAVDGGYKKDAFEGNLDGTLKLHSYGGGIRISSRRNPKVTPFGQVIVGGVNVRAGRGEEDLNAFQVTAGGGVNIPVNDKWGIRGEGDYRGMFFKDEDGGTVNAFRAVVGVYFALGQ